MAVLLGIDAGTTNWKAAAFSPDGRLLSIQTTPTIINYTAEGRAYYDPQRLWRSVTELIRHVVDEVRSHGSIQAVAVTGMGEAVVPVDKNGEPVGHIVPWFDTRSSQQADSIKATLGAERVFQITGLECNPIFSLPKIMWVREHQPETYRHTATWLSVVDYINLKLSGVSTTDFTQASRTLLLDLRTNGWSDEMCAVAGIDRSVLPAISPSGTRLGRVTAEAGRETNLSPETNVILGGHDHLCGALAAGVLLGNRVLDSSGTAESIVGFSAVDQPPPATFQGLRLGRYLDPRRFVTWGGIIASGRSVDWAIEVVGSHASYDEINAMVERTTAGSGGLLYLPHLRGCGAPHWNPGARGALVGLRDHHTSAKCIRAVMEGLSFEARSIVEVTEAVFGSPVAALNTIGGGARSAVWQQIKADITGRDVEIPEVEEATVMGTALIAGIGIGEYTDLEEASRATYRVRRRFTPNPKNRERYDALYDIYRRLYGVLDSIHTELTDLEGRMNDEKAGI